MRILMAMPALPFMRTTATAKPANNGGTLTIDIIEQVVADRIARTKRQD
jgi:hypothetical protein